MLRRGKLLPVKEAASGFTIIELMIATLVFSVVLVVITSGVLSFTHGYYKGLNVSRTQSATQNALDQMTQSIQYSSKAMDSYVNGSGVTKAYCFGNVQYAFEPGLEQMNPAGDGQVTHSLYRKVLAAGVSGCPAPSFSAADSTDLLTDRMRASKIKIDPVGLGVYTLHVRITYGDDDLLTNPRKQSANCKLGITGSQFCAVSELSTTVQMRKL